MMLHFHFGRESFLVKCISAESLANQIIMRSSLVGKMMRFCLVLALTSHSDAQNYWNPSLTETQRMAAMINLERVQAEALRASSLHTVIRLCGEQCRIGVVGNSNLVVFKPLHSEAIDAHLFATDGKEVSKGWFNHEFGQTLKPDEKLLDGSFAVDLDAQFGHSRRLYFPRDSDAHYWDLDVLKSFRVKSAGQYRLQVQVRLFTKDTNGIFQPFILPPVETNIEISVSDLGK